MVFTVDGGNGSVSFMECFDKLLTEIESHYLLTADERAECVFALNKLKRVFSRFDKAKENRQN